MSEIEDSSEDEEDVEIQETEMTVNDESEQMISESKIFRNPVTIPNNQTNVQYEEDKAYTSTIYSMLKVSQIGYMSIINQESVESEQGFIKVVSVNGKEDTEKLIKEYISSGDAYYSTMECPTGCHWESITYDVKYPDPTGLYYTNIEFVGLDGELLKYKGVQYSKRTYDILNRAKENNGWNEGFIAFYAVPNGCTQYAIACGDPAGDGYQAYYKITGERKK